MTVFNYSGPWKEIGADLAACKPLFIVSANNERYTGFEPLEQLLQAEYRQVNSLGVRAFTVFVRKSHKVVR